jgi:hypothetical protein
VKQTNARYFPLWPEALRRCLGDGFGIGGIVHHHPIQRPTLIGWAFSIPDPAEHAGFARILRVPTGSLSNQGMRLKDGIAHANDCVLYSTTSGHLYYDVGDLGNTAGVAFAKMQPNLALTVADCGVV